MDFQEFSILGRILPPLAIPDDYLLAMSFSVLFVGRVFTIRISQYGQ